MQPASAVLARLGRIPFLFRAGLAFLAGAAGAWAMPPDANPWALILYHGGVLALLTTTGRMRGGFGIGWAGGFGFHLIGLSWVGEAFLVDAAQFGWMRPIAMAGLPALLAIFSGAAGAVWTRFARTSAFANVALYTATFSVAEWLRGHILTGFPWNLPVQAWDGHLSVLQGVAWIGPYGVSLLTVLAATSVGTIMTRNGRTAIATIAVSAIPMALLAGLGIWKLQQAPAQAPTVPGVKLRLVQPNVPQTAKWSPELRVAHFNQLLTLSRDAEANGVTHIVWPEAATPFLLLESPTAMQAIASIVPKNGALLTGTPRRIERAGTTDAYNAIVAINDSGTAVAVYDKRHLVPFGEYVPLREWLPIDRLAPGRGDFATGNGPHTLSVPNIPDVNPQICYEAIFPGETSEPSSTGRWLLNATNDAWFGSSSGPYQHLSIARLRAIEQGMPMIRVANTGISAVIDPYGRIVQKLGLDIEAILDSPLPNALPRRPVYARNGNTFFFVIMFLLILRCVFAKSFSRHDYLRSQKLQ
jgi:apolipoprotein N-acyltransferase